MVVAAQSQANNDALIKEVQTNVDGLLKRNPNGWEGHKLSGDVAMLSTAKLYRGGDVTGAKRELGVAIVEYRKALASKPADPVINLALGRTLVVDGEYDEGARLFHGLIEKDKTNLNGYMELYRLDLA
jgi:predicted Zn-dependent protease